MATQAEIREYEEDSSNLTTLALAGLVAFWESLDLEDAPGVQAALEAVLPDLLDEYAAPMAALAADWYDELREQAQVRGAVYLAAPAVALTAAELESLAGWTANALYGLPDFDLALSRLAGGFQRHVVNSGRDTIEGNTALDPSRPRFARHASANACAFCRLLATRNDVYASKEAAERVVGRLGPRNRFTGGRERYERGTREIGSKYHDYCRCIGVPVFPGQTYEAAPYVKDWSREYAESAQFKPGMNGPIVDLPATLSTWRGQFDAT